MSILVKRIILGLLLALLVACSPATTGSGTQEPGPAGDQPEPPPATLTIDGETQSAGIGTYCWGPGTASGTAVCADMIGIPSEPQPLTAGTTFLAEFELPALDGVPDELSLSVIPVTGQEPLPGEIRNWLWWEYGSGTQHSLPLDRRPSIELSLEPGRYVLNLFMRWSPYGDASYGFLVDIPVAMSDAAAFAEAEGISLDEAARRLRFQETIGEIQPQLTAGLAETFGGLWIEHQPEYRIVIALTDGDSAAVQPYIAGYEWAEWVEVRPVARTLQALLADQQAVGEAAAAVNVAVTTAVDVVNNRVELMVGNPELFLADLAAAGLSLPESVVVLPSLPGQPLPETNQGLLLEMAAPDGRTLYLPKQPPTGVSMQALMEGMLIEAGGCLRIAGEGYPEGFLILWPYDTELRLDGDLIEVINGQGQVIGRVGQALSLGGGAMESAAAVSSTDQSIPGLPIDGCPGPYWVAGQVEPLAE